MKTIGFPGRLHRPLVIISLATIICIQFLATTPASAQPRARLGVSPDKYLISFDERGAETQSLTVQNLSDEPLTLSLSVNNWDLDERNQVRLLPPEEDSLDQWIVINPVRITVPPNSPQTIRWAVMPRLKPENGEYRAMVFLEEELPAKEQSDKARLRMKMRYGLPVYAQVGDPVVEADLLGVNIDRDNNRLYVDVANTGNQHGRISGNYGIWPADGFPGRNQALETLRSAAAVGSTDSGVVVGAMPDTVVLPQNRRQVALDLVAGTPGRYVVQLNGTFANIEITDTLELTVPGAPAL